MAEPTVGSFNAEIDALRASLKGLREDIAKLSGGGGTGNMMPNYSASTSIFNTGQGAASGVAGLATGIGSSGFLGRLGTGAFGKAIGGLAGLGGTVLAGAANLTSMMPGMEKYLVRETGYYQAGVNSMGALGLTQLKNATMSGIGKDNLTAVGSDATVAAILTGRGVNPNKQLYGNLLAGIGNAARYMNQSNEVAAQSMEAMTSGATSSSLLSRGIFTSNPNGGAPLKEQQIFEQLWQRWVVDKSITKSEMQDEIRRGFIGANIDSLDIDSAAKERLKVFLIAHSKDDGVGGKAGISLDITSTESMEQAFGGDSQLATGVYTNPMLPAYQIASQETSYVESFVTQYGQGFKDAAGAIGDLQQSVADANDTFSVFSNEMKKASAFLSTFMGSDIGAGFMSGGWMFAAPALLGTFGQTAINNTNAGISGSTTTNGGGGSSGTSGTDPGGAWDVVMDASKLQQGGADFGATDGSLWGNSYHHGVDFWAPVGTDVYAAYDGTVTNTVTSQTGSLGTYIVMDHGGGWTTTYAHLSKILVSEKQFVKKGTKIGETGKSGQDAAGNQVGAHLHFAAAKDGKYVNPNTFTDTIAAGLQVNGGGGVAGSVSGASTGVIGSYSPVLSASSVGGGVLGSAGTGMSSSGGSSTILSGGGNNVTIHVTVAQASDAEAIRLAELVKAQLQQDSFMSNMGAY